MSSHRTPASIVVIALALTLPLSSCATATSPSAPVGASTAAAVATVSPAPEVTTSAARDRLTVAEAGKRYLEVTKAYNVALEAFERGFNNGESLRTLQGRARAVAKAATSEAEALGETAWPERVEPLATSLAGSDRQAANQWLALARSDTKNAMLTAVRKLPTGADTGAQIRKLLGLPKYDENSY